MQSHDMTSRYFLDRNHPLLIASLLAGSLTACGGGGADPAAVMAANSSTDVSSATIGVAASSSSDSTLTASTLSDDGAVALAAVARKAVSAATALEDAMSVVQAYASSVPGLKLSLPTLPTLAAYPTSTQGRVFYVDSAIGDDKADGLSVTRGNGHGPWQTLLRLQQAKLVAGDVVKLACGGVWHETLALGASGSGSSPIIVTRTDASCDTPPLIDGSTSLAPGAWSVYKGSIYKATLRSTPFQLVSDAGPLVAAHYPNQDTVRPTAGGPAYAALAAPSDGATLTVGSDLTLPPGATFSSEAKARIRVNDWWMDEVPIVAFDRTRLTLSRAPTYTAQKGWGYLLVGQLWMLDGPGEWYYDAPNRAIYVQMPDSRAPTLVVDAATLSTGIDVSGASHVVIDGLAIRNVQTGVDARKTVGVTVRNLRILEVAGVGVDAGGSTDDVLEGNTVVRSGSAALTGSGGVRSPSVGDANRLVVRGNLVHDSGVRVQGDQVLSLPQRSFAAIFAGQQGTVSGNIVVNAAYHGIQLLSDGVVADNLVFGACSLADDCGAIYMWGKLARSQIRRNIVLHTRQPTTGTPASQQFTLSHGIYLDDDVASTTVDGNTVVDADCGVVLHNARMNTVTGNRLLSNRQSQICQSSASAVSASEVNTIRANLLAPTSSSSTGVTLETGATDIGRFSSFDGNRFDDRFVASVASISTQAATYKIPYDAWKGGATGALIGSSVDSTGTAVSGAGYATFLSVGSNLMPAALDPDMAGWGSWNQLAPAGKLSRETCPSGPCLRYLPGGSDGLVSAPAVALVKGNWYRLSVDIATETDLQSVNLIVRQNWGDYASVSDRDLRFIGSRTWQRHSVVFQATRTLPTAAVQFTDLVSGKSMRFGPVELKTVVMANTGPAYATLLNASGEEAALACPFVNVNAALCTQLIDMADDQPITFPVKVAAHTTVYAYVVNPSLLDRDGDGIPDIQDNCPGTASLAQVNSSGCAIFDR